MASSQQDYAVAIIPPAGDIILERCPKGTGELEALQGYVRGYIEVVRVKYNGRSCVAYVNEDGRSLGLDNNSRASKAYLDAHPQMINASLDGKIVGTMVIQLESA